MRIIYLIIFFVTVSCANQKIVKESGVCNFVYFSLDTLRADYINDKLKMNRVAPTIASFSEHSTVFSNVFTPSYITLQSHMSLLTSLYPSHHKVFQSRISIPQIVHGVKNFRGDVLAKDVLYYPELFKHGNYRTIWFGGTPGDRMLNAEAGFSRGIDKFENQSVMSDLDVQNVLSSISESNEQFFLFLHTWRLHLPHTLPVLEAEQRVPWDLPQTDLELSQFSDLAWNNWPLRNKDYSPALLPQLHKGVGYKALVDKIEERKDWGNLVLSYERSIKYVDSLFKIFLDGLRDRGLLRNTVIVLGSDHGESLGEHNVSGHADFYDNIIHVPLIVNIPQECRLNEGKLINQNNLLMSTVDIFPTILSQVKIPEEMRERLFQAKIDGHSIMDKNRNYVFGFQKLPDNTIQRYVRSFDNKIIEDGLSKRRFYDLRVDGEELRPLGIRSNEDFFELEAVLDGAL